MTTTRRAILQQTAGLAVTTFFGRLPKAWGAPLQTTQPTGWYDRPMRWAQIGFAEDDPGNYNPQFWLDYFKRLHIDAVCLNAGGAVAFYPTQIPLHYRSKWLGT